MDKKMTLVEYLFRHKGVTENGKERAYNIYDLKDTLSKTMFGEKGRITHIIESSEGELTQSDYEAFKIIWNQMFEYLAEWHQ
jgi:hypothetical protein